MSTGLKAQRMKCIEYMGINGERCWRTSVGDGTIYDWSLLVDYQKHLRDSIISGLLQADMPMPKRNL